ncbi:GL11009 [Drosophila persimilis]|uniref:GL11009 n=1 Tax=Drosophila persimilis TaxID=7234 RepID=B4GBX5_DROPE|nr:GL11009 [Drosophila persimilis]
MCGKGRLLRAMEVASVVLVLGLLLAVAGSQRGSLMDLYDDVSDFFDAISLDDVANTGRNTHPEQFCLMPARKGKKCVEFKFGGCDGNENNFSSYKDCMSTCEGM